MSFGRVEADLEVGAAVEDVKRLVSVDVIMRTRLEAELAVFLDDLKGLVGVGARDFDDDLVGLSIGFAFTPGRSACPC